MTHAFTLKEGSATLTGSIAHGFLWLHDLVGGEDETAILKMMRQAFRKAKELGFTEVAADVDDPKMMELMRKRGWVPRKVILTKEI